MIFLYQSLQAILFFYHFFIQEILSYLYVIKSIHHELLDSYAHLYKCMVDRSDLWVVTIHESSFVCHEYGNMLGK